MRSRTALVLFYHNIVKNSLNALAGAVETESSLNNIKIYFPEHKKTLLRVIGRIIEDHKTTVLGISFCTTEIWQTYRLMRLLRSKYGDKLICIAGGPHATGDPRGTLDIGFDIAVVGEGEKTIIELLKKIDRGESCGKIKGIAFFDRNGDYRYTGARSSIDLDRYPPFAVKHGKFGPIEITRGCPFFCSYCQISHMYGARPRHRSVEKIREYIQIMLSKGQRLIEFITPNALSYGSADGRKPVPGELERLLKGVRAVIRNKGKLTFGTDLSELRPEQVTKEAVELLLKYSDNGSVTIGTQSGSQKMIDICHRGHTKKDVYRAVEMSLAAGLKVDVDFIFGLPGETKADLKATLVMMKKLAKRGVRFNVHSFLPLPQTRFENERPQKSGREAIETVSELKRRGLVPCSWKKQEKMGNMIQFFRQLKDIARVPRNHTFSGAN